MAASHIKFCCSLVWYLQGCSLQQVQGEQGPSLPCSLSDIEAALGTIAGEMSSGASRQSLRLIDPVHCATRVLHSGLQAVKLYACSTADLQSAILKPSSVQVFEDGLYELVVVLQVLEQCSTCQARLVVN